MQANLGRTNACEVTDFRKHPFPYVHTIAFPIEIVLENLLSEMFYLGFNMTAFRLYWLSPDKKNGVHVGTTSLYSGNLTRFLWENCLLFLSQNMDADHVKQEFFPTNLFPRTSFSSINFEHEAFPQLPRYNSDFFSLSKAKVAFTLGFMVANFCSRFSWLQLKDH